MSITFKLYLFVIKRICSKQKRRELAGEHLGINCHINAITDQNFVVQYAALLAKHYDVEPEHVLAQSWHWTMRQNIKTILRKKTIFDGLLKFKTKPYKRVVRIDFLNES